MHVLDLPFDREILLLLGLVSYLLLVLGGIQLLKEKYEGFIAEKQKNEFGRKP
jgi:hypothetical protein